MQRRSFTHDDTSYEPAARPLQDVSDGLAGSEDQADYQGRHVRLEDPCAGSPTEAASPVNGFHPRRRGFGILSRLARVEADFSATAVTGAHAAV